MRLFSRNSQPSLEATAPYERVADIEPYPEIPADYLPDNAFVHLHFAPHATREHFEGAAQLLGQADIFLPEAGAWDPKLRRDFIALTRGDEKRYRDFKRRLPEDRAGHALAVIDAIYKRGKFLDFIDIKGDDFEIPRHERQPYFTSVEDALQYMADRESHFAFNSGLRRDRIMAGNLGSVVTRIVEGNRPLRRKDEVGVLVVLGSAHEGLYHYLQGQDGSKDKLAASQWKGDNRRSPVDVIRFKYANGETPSRGELLAELTMRALARQLFGRPDGSIDVLLSQEALESIAESPEDRLGLLVHERIQRDIHEARVQQYVLNIFNQEFDRKTALYLKRQVDAAYDEISAQPSSDGV